MIDKQKLISELKKQIESNKKHIKELQDACGSNYIMAQELYGSLIANLNGQNAICEVVINNIENGYYDTKEDESKTF